MLTMPQFPHLMELIITYLSYGHCEDWMSYYVKIREQSMLYSNLSVKLPYCSFDIALYYFTETRWQKMTKKKANVSNINEDIN